ncbi:signal peptidase I [Enterococcus sp. LJL99]
MKKSSTHKRVKRKIPVNAVKKKNNKYVKSKKKKKGTTNKRGPITSKKKKRRKRKTKKKYLLYEMLLSMTIFLVIVGTICFFTVRIVTVDGYSMTPRINDQDRLFVIKQKNFRRFDLVAFKNPENSEILVQRIVGLPGEEISYKNGALLVNGNEIPERFLQSKQSKEALTEDFSLSELGLASRIPENHYFILGDNREYANDSRYFGFVKKENIIGKIEARIFPIHKIQQF